MIFLFLSYKIRLSDFISNYKKLKSTVILAVYILYLKIFALKYN